MIFEWDPDKSIENQKKHGVSFEDSLQIWQEPYVEIQNIAYAKGESRSATLGKISDKFYVAIWTWRDDKIRLISVRRARKNEEKIYKKKLQDSQGHG